MTSITLMAAFFLEALLAALPLITLIAVIAVMAKIAVIVLMAVMAVMALIDFLIIWNCLTCIIYGISRDAVASKKSGQLFKTPYIPTHFPPPLRIHLFLFKGTNLMKGTFKLNILGSVVS